MRARGLAYGSDAEAGKGKTVVIDYSSPNIAKPIGFHHIRTTCIGPRASPTSTASQGWRVEGINYLGDWGKQFGLVAVGFQEYGDPARSTDMAHLVEVYVKANERAEKDPAFDERARAFFRRMEDGRAGGAARSGTSSARRRSRASSASTRGSASPSSTSTGESLYQGKMDAVIDEIARTVGVKESRGRAHRGHALRGERAARPAARRTTAARSTPRATWRPPRTATSASTSTARSTSWPGPGAALPPGLPRARGDGASRGRTAASHVHVRPHARA